MGEPVCFKCKGSIPVDLFLRNVAVYLPLTYSGNSGCPMCQSYCEFQIQTGKIIVGYTYWAGSLHFEGVETYNVPGLSLCQRDGVFVATWNGKEYPFPPPAKPA